MRALYNYIKKDCIALYKAGSLAVPFLTGQRDYEYALIYNTFQDRAKCIETLYPQPTVTTETITNDLGEEEVIEHIEEHEPLIDYHVRFVNNLPVRCEIWSYQYHYAYIGEHYGQDVPEYDYNILDHKKDYIDKLIAFYYKSNNKSDKQWYHVLIGLYILDNNSYELTQAQQQEVQLAHDNQMTDIAYNYAINKIKDYIKNYDIIGLSTAELEIIDLKKHLADTDYQAIKFAEGELSAEDFAPIKAQRRQWRARINELEEQL